MLSMERIDAGKWSRLTIVRAPNGWEIRVEREGASVRVSLVSDWHRVERSIQLFDHGEGRLSEPLCV
jgi:hypothetical protein